MDDYPSRLADRFMIRMPDGWRERLKENAARNRRSMNAEILCILQGALGAAAGGDLAGLTPAAGNDEAALPGGASITQGIGGAANE